MLLALAPSPASADEVLSRERVIQLARQQAPAVRVADARTGEARALRVGARAPTAANPEVGISFGPRALASGTIVDVIGTLAIPIDVSRAPNARGQAADRAARAAEAEADNARRLAVAAALDAWVAALGAEERIHLDAERARLDATLWTSADARRRAGTIGDFDLQLAAVLRADGQARLRRAEGTRDAILIALRARLGLPSAARVQLAGALPLDPAPSLEALLAHLGERPDRVAAELRTGLAEADARVQRRLGVPAPRLTATGGRDSELFARFGVDVPLPLYQRNQTARAVADAHQATASAERDLITLTAEAELRAAYADYFGARRAFDALDAAVPSMADAEHLATRAYELGQAPLASLVIARRETANARAAHLDAKIALGRARVALDAAAGAWP